MEGNHRVVYNIQLYEGNPARTPETLVMGHAWGRLGQSTLYLSMGNGNF